MIYDLASVIDKGSYWQVTNVTANTLENIANESEQFLKLSFVSAKQIKDAILEGKQVHVDKTLRTNEVMPGEYTILDGSEVEVVQAARDAATVKVRMLVTPELSKIAALTMYGFIVLNNDLVNAGYAITNENREEKYLSILETGDEKLIAKLEDYLNYKDEIESVAHLERKFSKFRADIKSASSVEEVKTLESNFLEKFYATF